MLADSRFPILQRIWFRHLFWIGYFAGGFLRLYLSDFRRTGAQTYCKLADALLGGNRTERFLEARKQKLAELKARNRLRAETRRQQDDVIFQLRLRHEANVNLNFVATPHTHQDRLPAVFFSQGSSSQMQAVHRFSGGTSAKASSSLSRQGSIEMP